MPSPYRPRRSPRPARCFLPHSPARYRASAGQSRPGCIPGLPRSVAHAGHTVARPDVSWAAGRWCLRSSGNSKRQAAGADRSCPFAPRRIPACPPTGRTPARSALAASPPPPRPVPDSRCRAAAQASIRLPLRSSAWFSALPWLSGCPCKRLGSAVVERRCCPRCPPWRCRRGTSSPSCSFSSGWLRSCHTRC